MKVNIFNLKISFLFLVFIALTSFEAKAGWVDMETGILDDLTGVVFWADNGAVSGHSGIYYTTDGGVDALSWTRFDITSDVGDSVVYNNTKFSHSFAFDTDIDYMFACGQDTVNDKAIILQFHIPTQSYIILFEGVSGTNLNNINYSEESNQYYAVGDNELIVKFDLDVVGEVESSGGTINFTSISFNDEKFNIGADGYKIYGEDNDPDLSFTMYAAPGFDFKDVYRYSATYGNGVGNGMYTVNSLTGVITENTAYAFGPLNANSIYKFDGDYFIGTDHGIFFYSPLPYEIEWQPSSLTHYIYDFWGSPLSTDLYACGKNGVLLKTSDNGGLPLPYLNIDAVGGCKDQFFYSNGTFGRSSTCEWHLNGVLVSSSCTNYGTSFDTTGIYELKLIGTNLTGSDSSVVYFYVVDTPMVNLTTVLDDTLLCQEEAIEITIDSSEIDVVYSLYNLETLTNYGFSTVGDGEELIFMTDLVDEEGEYVIMAKSALAACSNYFTDTIHIGVEKTKADFHTGKFNIVEDEIVKFYENCTDADNYQWTFPADAAFLSSDLADPVNSFETPGIQTIELITWSDNDCYDTIVGEGARLYVEPEVYDSCWVNIGHGHGGIWGGRYYPDIYDLKEVSSGYIISGTYYDQIFATTYGDSLIFPEQGAYMSKYDLNGVHKWSVYSLGSNGSTKFSFKSVDEDSQGNIIGVGYFNDYYVDNSGDTILIPTDYGQIIKMDSLGKNIWTRSANFFKPEHVVVDDSDNIIISSRRREDDLGISIKLYYNDTVLDTLEAPEIVNFSLTKLNPEGFLLWDIPIYNDYVNSVHQRCPQVDDSNNVYLASIIEYGATIYDVDNPGGVSIDMVTWGGFDSYLAKFDSSGHHLWNIITATVGTIGPRTKIHDIYTDGEGNSYFSGSNMASGPDYDASHRVYSTDDTYIEHKGGKYFVAKVNSEGIAQWVKGAYTSYYGDGFEIDVKNDTVYVLGRCRENDDVWDTLQFNNPDGSFVELPITRSDYFVAAYDTAGVLLWISKNADNWNWLNRYGWHGFFKSEGDAFFIAQSGQLSDYDWLDFGNAISPTDGIESWVTKMCKDCGILYIPEFKSILDTTLCIGSSYTFPDGTISVMLEDIQDTTTLVSVVGLDSLIITNIHVDGYLDLVDSVFICAYSNYVFPDSSEIDSVTTVTTHVSPFTTLLGCDSLISTVLIPYPVYHLVDTVYHCPYQSYVFPDLTTITGIDGPYTHTSNLTTASLCDSIINTTLMPLPEFYQTDSITICYGDDFTYPDGLTEYDILASTTHASIYDTPGICDSTIFTVLTVNGLVPFTDQDTVCAGAEYTFHDGTVISDITIAVTHASFFTDVYGCDSTVETTVHPLIIDNTVTQTGVELTSNHLPAVGVSYQWVDCDDSNEPIIGETNQIFTPAVNGNYAVLITVNECSDISPCTIITGVGLEEEENYGLSIYPNPTNGKVTVAFDYKNMYSMIQVLNPLGQLMFEIPVDNTIEELTLGGSDGVYFLRFIAVDGGVTSIRIVKQ